MKKTKYKNSKASLWGFIAYILFILSFLYIAYIGRDNKTLYYYFLAFSGVTLVSGFPYAFGLLKGLSFVKREDTNLKKDNSYLYYRKLPNDFGIGVTSILADSKIENRKDIVAVILDLCAKKYLSLSKVNNGYQIHILKGIDDQLLLNEKYIMELIVKNDLKRINYQKWYNYCLDDGKQLDLYYHSEKEQERSKKQFKTIDDYKIIGIISVLGGIIYTIARLAIDPHFLDDGILLVVTHLMMSVFFIFFLLMIVSTVVLIVVLSVKTNVVQYKGGYDEVMSNHLTRTSKGIDEYQKLLSFRDFLADFGHFVDKHPEEVVIWDRYLSYAQVFGLTKEIMKSGYQKLVNNSSFQIDDVNNITIDNIEIEMP